MYPRVDDKFKKKHSYNYDMMKTNIMKRRPTTAWKVSVCKWFAFFCIGVFTGTAAFLMACLEDWLIETRSGIMDKILEKTDGSVALAWVFLGCWAMFFAGTASVFTIYVGPGANGSGIAEIFAILNGVNYPRFVEWKSLFVKCFCVIFAIVGSLCVGKEGPLAHIGAVVALCVIHYMPIKEFEVFKNDVSNREFLAGGVSAGVSAAFGAPIGGTLFAYEVSSPTTFWTFSLIWRVFFCCSWSTFTLSILSQLKDEALIDLKLTSAGTLKFG